MRGDPVKSREVGLFRYRMSPPALRLRNVEGS